MQRRAAAVSTVVFLLVGAGAYGLIATAEQPHVEIDDGQRLSAGDTLSAGGQTYTVDAVKAEMSGGGGGHGGGGGETLERSAEIGWTEESARYTASWDNGSVVTHDGEEWTVVVDAAEDPTTFTLREEIDRQAILQNDSEADNETVTRNGTEYVVVEDDSDDDNASLVPAAEYFPEPERRQFAEGDAIDYQEAPNQSVSVDAVDAETVTLAWTAPKEHSTTVTNHANVTLGGETYFAHFPNNETVVLSQNFGELREEQRDIDEYKRHRNGLWGVSILSGVVASLMVAMAFLPSRY
ncbi:MAG: hypothetical protein ABEJ79_05465 [Halolamina sp.]